MKRIIDYAKLDRGRQVALRAQPGRYPLSGTTSGKLGAKFYDVILPEWEENLYDPIRQQAIAYFDGKATNGLTRKGPQISWHRMRAHVLSSQVSCVNVLMPFATRRDALAALLAPLFPGQRVTPLPNQGRRNR